MTPIFPQVHDGTKDATSNQVQKSTPTIQVYRVTPPVAGGYPFHQTCGRHYLSDAHILKILKLQIPHIYALYAIQQRAHRLVLPISTWFIDIKVIHETCLPKIIQVAETWYTATKSSHMSSCRQCICICKPTSTFD